MSAREFLKRRNALWRRLRELSADDTAPAGGPEGAAFEATLAELMALIGWDRERVLRGLGRT